MAIKKETITYTQVMSEVMKGKFAPIYVLMGEEAFYIDKISDMIVQKALTEDERDFNLTIFYGADADVREVINSCKRYPAMSKYQVVILREAQMMKGNDASKDLDLLQHYAKNPLQSTILVVCNKHGNIKAPEFVKEAKANGIVFESKKITESGVGKVIKDYVMSKGFTIDDKSTAMMKDYVGTDVSRLFAEIDKLTILVKETNKITPELIEKNIGISKDFNNFELESAIRTRNIVKSNQIIDYFEKNPKNNPTVVTVGILFSFFSNLFLTCTSRDKSEAGVMARLGTKSPYRAKIFIEATRYYSTASCVNVISYLREFDTRSKGIGSRENEYDLLRELIYKILHS
jgi:DNA polymerase-3 subunit delta